MSYCAEFPHNSQRKTQILMVEFLVLYIKHAVYLLNISNLILREAITSDEYRRYVVITQTAGLHFQ